MDTSKLNLQRKVNFAQITGPIPLISLILSICEFTLAWSLINVTEIKLQWFLAISMVSLLGFTIICFFILIFFLKEHAYSPDSYPEDVIRKLFRINKKQNTQTNQIDLKGKIFEKIEMNGDTNLSEFISESAIEFECNESKIRESISSLQKEDKIEITENEVLGCIFISKK